MSVKFINTTQNEFLKKKTLNKYMPLEFALEKIVENYIWFANPTKWVDPFEKRFIEGKYLRKGTEIEFPLKGRVFCTCMTETSTSEAHWNIYSRDQIGISFTYKRDELLKVLNKLVGYDVYIGKVKYLISKTIEGKLSDIDELKAFNPININDRELQLQLLLLKRKAFEYENEIRIILIKKDKTKEAGLKIDLNISNDLIDKITIHPSVENYTEMMLKDLFKVKYGFKKVFKSNLYSMKNDITITV